MSATDDLRRMLDERGVEHEDDEDVTRFFGPDGFEVVMQGDIDGKLDCLTPLYLTPAQAIAATLGATDARPTQVESSGTCHITDNGPWGYPYVCSACGASFDPDVNGGDYNFCPNCGRRVEQ